MREGYPDDDVVTEILCSDRAVVAIAPHDGGRLVSLELDGAELIGRGTPEAGLPPGWYHGSFPMAPYAGRVKDATFRFDGTTYRLPPNAGPHAGHGLVFDVPWSTVTPSTGSRVVLATPLDGRWPFGGTVEQVVALDGTGLSVTLTLSNDDRPMPGALGFHPWFRRDLGHGPARFSFEPTRRFAPAADGFPRLLDVKLRRPNIFGDMSFCRGEVAGKRIEDGLHLVDLTIRVENQLGETTATGTATVELPSRRQSR